MNFEDIIRDLRNKKYKPVYFLMGEEAFFIDRIIEFISANVLTESERTFNQIVLYGKDTDVRTVIETARRYPMMASHFVLIVKEAQHLGNLDELIHYVEKPQQTSILAIGYKYRKLDKRTKLYRAISEKGVVFDSKKLYEDKVPDWIMNYMRGKNRTIEPKAAVILTEHIGNDLGRIVSELDKLMISLPEDQTVNAGHIEQYIGISKEYNNFELHKALGLKDVLKANRIINYFAQNPKNNPLTVTITSLYFYFSKVLLYHSLEDKTQAGAAAALKVNPYFVKDYQQAARAYPRRKTEEIISLIREYDARSKGYGGASTPEGELLRELVFKILH
jgi:DNA polymerase-3 subunit delta